MTPRSLAGNIPGRGYARVEVQGRCTGSLSIEGPEVPGEAVLTPGLVDIQLNGFAGIDFSSPELTAQSAIDVLPHLWKTGVTSFCPTLITNSRLNLARNFRILEQARASDARFAAAVPGYHLEGPYFAPGNARGVHDPRFMRPPDWDEFVELQAAAGGNIAIVTLAPELPGALDFIARARAAGVVVALGHTEASPEQVHAAVDAGASLSTHLGNGCPQMLDRHANPLWAQLTRDELAASIICDTFHLPPDVIQVILRLKGPARTILITDATHVTTLAPGRYSIVGTAIDLLPDGKVVRADGGCLGGSALTMNRAVGHFIRLSGASLKDAVMAATRNPAALLGRPGLCADIEPGVPANLVLSRYGPGGLAIDATYLAGEEVYP